MMRIVHLAMLLAVPGLVSACASSGLRATYEAEARRLSERSAPAPHMITEEDLESLPPQVQRYLRRVGVLGRPHVRSFHATFDARIRGGPEEPWLTGSAEQYEFFDPPARLFYMKATRAGLPVHVLHRYVGGTASMEGRLLGLFTVLDVSGPELTQAETVTLLNDMFFLAPAALIDAPIEWEELDDRRVRATYTNAGHTVSAIAYFDANGDLVDFDSEDRYQVEHEPPRLVRWSTPLYEYGRYDGYRLATGGAARWGAPGEEWTYGEFGLESIRYNAHRDSPRSARAPLADAPDDGWHRALTWAAVPALMLAAGCGNDLLARREGDAEVAAIYENISMSSHRLAHASFAGAASALYVASGYELYRLNRQRDQPALRHHAHNAAFGALALATGTAGVLGLLSTRAYDRGDAARGRDRAEAMRAAGYVALGTAFADLVLFGGHDNATIFGYTIRFGVDAR